MIRAKAFKPDVNGYNDGKHPRLSFANNHAHYPTDNTPRGEASHSAKITGEQATEMRQRWARGDFKNERGRQSFVVAGREYGVTGSAAECVIHRVTWKHVP